jgi:tRNA A37 threonylcarbamoyladenosine dehydratase
MLEDWQDRTRLLIGDANLNVLSHLHILVAGVGGVGGYVVEALARAGVGELTLIDPDCVSISNRNRQLVALTSTENRLKVEVMKERILDINPSCQVNVFAQAICDNSGSFLQEYKPRVVIDAIDSVSCKVALLEAAMLQKIPVYSSMGAGKRLDVTALKVMDLMDTQACGLARIVRQQLRKRGVRRGIRCVVSTELPILTNSEQIVADGRLPNGTISYMPAMFGLLLAGEVLRDNIQLHIKGL